MERQTNLNKLFSIVVIILFSVGVVGHIFLKDIMLLLTPIVLLFVNISAIFLLFRFQNKENLKSNIIIIAIILVATLIIEIIGEKYGIIFGDYSYGDVLSYGFLEVMNVPIVISINWLIVIISSTTLATKLIHIKELQALATGIIAVVFDYAMEPVAIHLNYWFWNDASGFSTDIIPIQNYIAWFIISSIFSYIIVKSKLKINANFLLYIFFAELFFFQLLNLLFKIGV